MKTLILFALVLVGLSSCKKEMPAIELMYVNIEVRDIRAQVDGDPAKTPLALAVKRKFNTNDVSDDRKETVIINGVSYSHISYSLRYVEDVLPDESVVTQMILTASH